MFREIKNFLERVFCCLGWMGFPPQTIELTFEKIFNLPKCTPIIYDGWVSGIDNRGYYFGKFPVESNVCSVITPVIIELMFDSTQIFRQTNVWYPLVGGHAPKIGA